MFKDIKLEDFLKIVVPAIIAIASGLLTYLFTIYQKNRDYKKEYYKKIIESRLETYSLLQELLATLAHLTKDTNDSKCYYTLFRFTKLDYILNLNHDLNNNYKLQGEGDTPKLTQSQLNMYGYGLFVKDLSTILSKRAWLSNELVNELRKIKAIWDVIAIELNEQIEERVNPVDKKTISPIELEKLETVTVPDLIVLGKKYYPELKDIAIRVRKRTYYDVSTLHKVEDFIQEKLSDDTEVIPTLYAPKV